MASARDTSSANENRDFSGTKQRAGVSHQVVEQDALLGDRQSQGHMGERESFEEFYVRTWQGMVRLARILIDEAEDAVEVVQEAYVRVYTRFPAVQPDKTDAYLRASVLNGCRRYLRRRSLSRRHRASSAMVVSDVGADHIVDAVRSLSPDRRDVVVLRYYLDLSESQIAATLGIPAGTVKSRLHRALNDLAEALR